MATSRGKCKLNSLDVNSSGFGAETLCLFSVSSNNKTLHTLYNQMRQYSDNDFRLRTKIFFMWLFVQSFSISEL